MVVVVLDDATPMPAEEVQLARRLARAAIDHVGRDDLVAVVHAVNSRAGQGFTNDRAKLLASVDRFNGSIPMPDHGARINAPVVPGSYLSLPLDTLTLYLRMADTLREWAEYLAEIPQRRKALMYVSVGMPLDYSVVQGAYPPRRVRVVHSRISLTISATQSGLPSARTSRSTASTPAACGAGRSKIRAAGN